MEKLKKFGIETEFDPCPNFAWPTKTTCWEKYGYTPDKPNYCVIPMVLPEDWLRVAVERERDGIKRVEFVPFYELTYEEGRALILERFGIDIEEYRKNKTKKFYKPEGSNISVPLSVLLWIKIEIGHKSKNKTKEFIQFIDEIMKNFESENLMFFINGPNPFKATLSHVYSQRKIKESLKLSSDQLVSAPTIARIYRCSPRSFNSICYTISTEFRLSYLRAKTICAHNMFRMRSKNDPPYGLIDSIAEHVVNITNKKLLIGYCADLSDVQMTYWTNFATPQWKRLIKYLMQYKTKR